MCSTLCGWRRSEGKGTCCPPGVLHRAGFNGQRILGRCFPAVADRRPSAAGVSRSHDYDTQPSQGRPFTPLAPSPWCAVVLAYLKELENLTSKKTESKAKAKAKQDPAASSEDPSPSPRRKARFPKKLAKDQKTPDQ